MTKMNEECRVHDRGHDLYWLSDPSWRHTCDSVVLMTTFVMSRIDAEFIAFLIPNIMNWGDELVAVLFRLDCVSKNRYVLKIWCVPESRYVSETRLGLGFHDDRLGFMVRTRTVNEIALGQQKEPPSHQKLWLNVKISTAKTRITS